MTCQLARSRRGLSVVEVLIGTVILSLLVGFAMAGFNMLGKQSTHAFESLSQTQDALILLESIRLELASLVMNPFADAKDHEGNSFMISRPNGTSIQFVTEKREGGVRKRFLVYYEAKNDTGPKAKPGLLLKKKIWEFKKDGAWSDSVRTGWPADWVGAEVESQEARWKNLNIQDMRWQYLVPDENEGKVFFRVKLTLQAREGNRLLPLTTLVAVATPDLAASVSDCPCLFAAGYDATKPDACSFCVIQPPEPPPDPNAPQDDGGVQ